MTENEALKTLCKTQEGMLGTQESMFVTLKSVVERVGAVEDRNLVLMHQALALKTMFCLLILTIAAVEIAWPRWGDAAGLPARPDAVRSSEPG